MTNYGCYSLPRTRVYAIDVISCLDSELHAGKRRVRFNRGKRKQGEQGSGDPESSAEELAVPPYKEINLPRAKFGNRDELRIDYDVESSCGRGGLHSGSPDTFPVHHQCFGHCPIIFQLRDWIFINPPAAVASINSTPYQVTTVVGPMWSLRSEILEVRLFRSFSGLSLCRGGEFNLLDWYNQPEDPLLELIHLSRIIPSFYGEIVRSGPWNGDGETGRQGISRVLVEMEKLLGKRSFDQCNGGCDESDWSRKSRVYDVDGFVTETGGTPEPRPFFEDPESNITVQLGAQVHMHCRVQNLQNSLKVSWVRRRGEELHLLTIGLDTYASDSRFSLAFEKPNDWRLLLRSATERDAGLYECQVTAHPPLIRTVHLAVSVPKVEIVDEHGATAGDKFYKAGSTIELKCVVSNIPQPTGYVTWRHGSRTLNYDTIRGGI
ncbi:hypothetical protein HN011_003101, partial [Eciton burchellii]